MKNHNVAFLRDCLFKLQGVLRGMTSPTHDGSQFSLEMTLKYMDEVHGIRCKTDGKLVLCDYDSIRVKWTEPYGYVARGLVLDAKTFDVVAFGLPKFWNAGDGKAADLDWDSVVIFEKLDGTMVNRFWNEENQSFEYTTRFQLPVDMKKNRLSSLTELTWDQLVHSAIMSTPGLGEALAKQPRYQTWVLEVMSPLNQVVVVQRTYKAALLAIRDNATLEETSVVFNPAAAPAETGFFSVEQVKAVADAKPGTESEGFVAVDKDFNRLKIKNDKYCALHHLKDNINSAGSLVLLAKTGDFDDVACNIPMYKEPLEKAHGAILQLYAQHEAAYEELKGIADRKEFALAVVAKTLPMPGVLFLVRDKKSPDIKTAMDNLREEAFISMVLTKLGRPFLDVFPRPVSQLMPKELSESPDQD